MALAKKNFAITNDAGNLVEGASVLVERVAIGFPSAQIYSDRDGITPLGNPYTPASAANPGFYAAPGFYRITTALGPFNRVWDDEVVPPGPGGAAANIIYVEGLTGSGDETVIVQGAVTTCEVLGGGEVICPPGVYEINDLVISGSVHLRGAMPQLFKGDANEALPGEMGTFFLHTDPSKHCVTLATGSNGGRVSEIGCLEDHDPDGPGWTPTNYKAFFKNIAAGSTIHDCVGWGVNVFVQIGDAVGPVGSGYVTIRDCYGACFTDMFDFQCAGDFTKVENCFFHGWFLQNATSDSHIVDYIQAHATVYASAYNAGWPSINGLHGFGSRYGIRNYSNGLGATNRFTFLNCQFDSTPIGADFIAGAEGTLDHFYSVGDPVPGGGGFGIQAAGIGTEIRVPSAVIVNADESAVYCNGDGNAAHVQPRIIFGIVKVDQPNIGGTGASAFNSSALGVIKFTSPPEITRFTGVIHGGGGVVQWGGIRSAGTGTIYDLLFKNDENFSGHRTLTLRTHNADRLLDLEGDFSKLGAHATIFRTGGATDLTFPTAGTMATTADITAAFANLDAMLYKGVINCSANPNYPAADAGHAYKVSVAGKIGGGSGPNVEVGDLLLCAVDSTAAGTHASVGANWDIVQVNIDGAVVGPASATDNGVPRFDLTTGKLLQTSGVAIDDSNNMTGVVSLQRTGGVAVQGINTNAGAAAGYVGEILTATASGVALTSTAPKTIVGLALNAGAYWVEGLIDFHPAASTTVKYQLASINTVNDTRDSGVGGSNIVPWNNVVLANSVATSSIPAKGKRLLIASSPTTVYLVGQSEFGVSTQTADGMITAQRLN